MIQIFSTIEYLKEKRSRQWGALTGLGELKLGPKKRLKLELVDTGLNIIGRFQINYLRLLQVINWAAGYSQEFKYLPLQDLRVKLGKVRGGMKINSIDGQALNHAPDFICYLDTKGNFFWVNATLLKELGYDSHELIGKSYEEFIHPEDRELAKARFSSLLNTQESNPSEIRIKKKDGTYFWGWVVGRILKQKGKVVGAALTIRDITERKEKEVEKIMRQRLESLRLIWEGINHDVNNAFFPIKGILDIFKVLRAMAKENPNKALEILNQMEYLEKIENSSERINRLTQKLHYFANFSGEAKVRTDLVALVEAVLSLMRGRFDRAEVKVIKHYPKSWNAKTEQEEQVPILLELHFNGVQVMLMDLLSNAIDAIVSRPEYDFRPKEIRILLDIVEEKEGKMAAIAIKDLGKGMSYEEQQKIFTPFFTTKPSGKGTGLGMTLAKHIVEEHGGKIKVYSKLGEGTTITILLPIDQSRA